MICSSRQELNAEREGGERDFAKKHRTKNVPSENFEAKKVELLAAGIVGVRRSQGSEDQPVEFGKAANRYSSFDLPSTLFYEFFCNLNFRKLSSPNSIVCASPGEWNGKEGSHRFVWKP